MVFEVAAQLKHALMGFMATLVALSVILPWFIPRDRSGRATPAAK